MEQGLAQLTLALTLALNQQTQILNGLSQAITTMNGQAAMQANTIQQPATALANINPPAQQQQSQFTTSPLSTCTGVIDYSTKEAAEFYKNATRSLLPKEEKFQLEPLNLNTFLARLRDRAKDLNMMANGAIGQVPEDATVQGSPTVNLFVNYGSRTLEQITAHERTYLNQQGRMAQDSKLLYDLILNSLTVDAQRRVSTYQKEHTLEIGGAHYSAGLCLFKIVIRESTVDSNATISATRLRLSSLDQYIRENGSDITAFNAHVETLLAVLESREEETHDLLVHLFKGYKACKDKQFHSYITRMEDDHNDGTKVIRPRELMAMANTYYKTRLEALDEPWEANQTEERLNALEAKMGKKGKTVRIVDPKSRTPSPKGEKGRGEKPKWMKDNIPPDNPQVCKVWSGNPYYWCCPETGGKCGGKWRAHYPWECTSHLTKATGKRQPRSKSPPKKAPKKQRAKQVQEAIAAQQALLAQIENESSEDEASNDQE